jgi:hypothetical protein
MNAKIRAQDPAEGSREVIERELRRQGADSTAEHNLEPVKAMADDIGRLLRDVDAATITAILQLAPSLADLEEAVSWTQGDGDILGKQGHALTGKAAEIFDLIHRDEQADDPFQTENH